jgi:hypothetical protein
MLRLTWTQKSSRMVLGLLSAELVSPSITRPGLTALSPSQTMVTTGPEAKKGDKTTVCAPHRIPILVPKVHHSFYRMLIAVYPVCQSSVTWLVPCVPMWGSTAEKGKYCIVLRTGFKIDPDHWHTEPLLSVVLTTKYFQGFPRRARKQLVTCMPTVVYWLPYTVY